MMIHLTPVKGEKFAKGVATAKQMGCRFDPQRKVWVRTEAALWQFVDAAKRFDQTRAGYLKANGLEIAGAQIADPATTWMGAERSMNPEESIF